MNIIYNPHILYSVTDTTTDYYKVSSGISSGINIYSGFTLNIGDFDRNIINRVDIISNVINYISDDENENENINRFQLNTLIVDTNQIYENITKTGNYCIKFSYDDNDEDDDIADYLIMNIIDLKINTTTTTTFRIISTTTTTNIKESEGPIIYYKYPISGTTWTGGGTIVPHDARLHLSHDGITGWTSDSLKYLFIDRIIDCFNLNISLDNIIFYLYVIDKNIILPEIIEYGIYNIYISVSDYVGNTTSSYIYNIIVNDSVPEIVFIPNVLTTEITGNTSDFSNASGITGEIYIESGFTLTLNQFDKNIIHTIDIINNLILYIDDATDPNINKYYSNVLIVGEKFSDYENIIYPNIQNPGYYCIKISITNNIGNEGIYYFILKVTYNISIFSQGYWQDGKVWIDSSIWIDNPIISKV